MTENQLEFCNKCLNRKKGISEEESICNIRGHILKTDEICTIFDRDKSVILDPMEKIERIKQNDSRAKNNLIFISIVMILEFISAISSYFQMSLLKDIRNGLFVSDDMINANDTREQIIGILYLIASIASIVFFILWFRRAYYNLNIRSSNTEHNESWAVYSWFVPIISIYRPYQIMKEMWTKTSISIARQNKSTIVDNSTYIISIWWTLWIISNYIGKNILKRAFNDNTIDDLINTSILEMSCSILGIPLAIITIIMIKEYSKKEQLLFEYENNYLKI